MTVYDGADLNLNKKPKGHETNRAPHLRPQGDLEESECKVSPGVLEILSRQGIRAGVLLDTSAAETVPNMGFKHRSSSNLYQ